MKDEFIDDKFVFADSPHYSPASDNVNLGDIEGSELSDQIW